MKVIGKNAQLYVIVVVGAQATLFYLVFQKCSDSNKIGASFPLAINFSSLKGSWASSVQVSFPCCSAMGEAGLSLPLPYFSSQQGRREKVENEQSLKKIKSVLSKYNLQKVKCTCFKCTVQWILTNVYTHLTITPIQILNISITPQSYLKSFAVNTLGLRQPLICFLSL